MNVGQLPTGQSSNKISVLLMDMNSERRALRTKILTLRGAEVVGATDLLEAASVWHRDRYDLILIDIRMDHGACIAWRDEIKKEDPRQVVAFLVGKPDFIALDPCVGSYIPEEHGMQWGDSLRVAIRKGCVSLPQRNGLVEARWRIATTKKLNGSPTRTPQPPSSVEPAGEGLVLDASVVEADAAHDAAWSGWNQLDRERRSE